MGLDGQIGVDVYVPMAICSSHALLGETIPSERGSNDSQDFLLWFTLVEKTFKMVHASQWQRGGFNGRQKKHQ